MNLSTSECSSWCESGWTTYLDHSSNSSDQYKTGATKNRWSKGFNVDDKEDEDLSMVSDASSGPTHSRVEEYCSCDTAYYSFTGSASKQGMKGKQKNKLKQPREGENKKQDAYLDDTASSPVLSLSKKHLLFRNSQIPMEQQKEQGFSGTLKGTSALKKQFDFLKSSVSGKTASEK